MEVKATNKEKYQHFLSNQEHVPIFLQPFWLDFVCGSENWEVSLFEKDNLIRASFVTYNKRKKGLKISTLPNFTQFIGMWVDQEIFSQDLYRQTSNMHLFQEFFISDIKMPLFFMSAFNFRISCFLPFHTVGFSIKPRYTYRIENYKNFDFRKQVQPSKRRNIKKAEKEGFEFRMDLSAEKFHDFHKGVMNEKGVDLKYDLKFLKDLMNLCKNENCGRSYYLLDGDGNINAAVMVVWDEKDAYHLIPATAAKGADGMTYLIEQLLKHLPSHIDNYDFEGSMIPGVERYYRSLANVRRIYYTMSKNPMTKILSV